MEMKSLEDVEKLLSQNIKVIDELLPKYISLLESIDIRDKSEYYDYDELVEYVSETNDAIIEGLKSLNELTSSVVMLNNMLTEYKSMF